jgi:hypothetical protein
VVSGGCSQASDGVLVDITKDHRFGVGRTARQLVVDLVLSCTRDLGPLHGDLDIVLRYFLKT